MDFSFLLKNFFLHTGLGFAAFFAFLSGQAPVLPPLSLTPLEGSGVEIEAAEETPPSAFPAIRDVEKTEEENPQKEAPAQKIASELEEKEEAVPPAIPPLPPFEAAVSPQTLNDKVREAAVNILCNAKTSVNPISGSGVLIDPRGVILTNAHVAQFFLLRNYPIPENVSCVIRSGSPARPLYKAELLFLSPSWIRNNAEEISKANPTGTGEGDYALLRITESVHPGEQLPAAFPFVPIDTSYVPKLDDSVLLAGYPAGFLGGITIETNLYAVSSFATIEGIYTFESNTEDLISVGGTPVAQKGSSGGGVVDVKSGKLVGIFVTSTDASTTGARDLRAITLPHINRNLSAYVKSMESLLSGDLAAEAAQFKLTTEPTLRQLLIEALDR